MALTKVSRGLLTTSIVDNGNATAITIDASENVGIGGSTITDVNLLNIQGSGASKNIGVVFNDTNTSKIFAIQNGGSALKFFDYTAAAERMRIDSAGNLLVGVTSTTIPGISNTTAGISMSAANGIIISRADNAPINISRNSSDGELILFRKDGTTLGSIGVQSSRPYFGNSINFSIKCDDFGGGSLIPANQSGTPNDNLADIGTSGNRWDNIYATNGTIQTSDRNEKQDIVELSDAEQRVAVACKGLLRKFRWIDAVEAKGDDARIHFGIIAQDLQAAFEAEGLDAARYAMFTSNTWWETQTEVAAVEATEDTKAVDAYTRTDTYDTAEEAPEGATERTRLGVRYSELLAFIISAI